MSSVQHRGAYDSDPMAFVDDLVWDYLHHNYDASTNTCGSNIGFFTRLALRLFLGDNGSKDDSFVMGIGGSIADGASSFPYPYYSTFNHSPTSPKKKKSPKSDNPEEDAATKLSRHEGRRHDALWELREGLLGIGYNE